MNECKGEVIGIAKHYDTVGLIVVLEPAESEDPSQIWEWRIGEKVKVIGDEPK